MGLEGLTLRLNNWAAHNFIGRYFEFRERNTKLTQELRGGTATFLTLAYVLAVNSAILSSTGGPCISEGTCLVGVPAEVQGGACAECVQEVRKSLITATAATCIIANFLMGVLGNMPCVLGPAMGLNAYFTYTVVGFMGSGRVPYKQALTAVFLEGFIFIILSVVKIRRKLVEYIPRSILLATTAGVGMFLAFIGLQASEGIGVVTYNSATLVTLGGCAPQYRVHQYTISEQELATTCVSSADGTCSAGPLVPSDTYQCLSSGIMRSPTMWLGIAGGMLMVVLMAWGVGGSFVIGIAFVTFISWIPSDGNAARYLQKPGDTPESEWTPAMQRWNFFKQVVEVPDISKTGAQLDFTGLGSADLWVALVTFLYVDFLDATGTLFSMANFVNLYVPGFLNRKTKHFPRQTRTFCVDGASISIGALMGLSPVTIAGESAAGIREGGRTGVTALTVSFYFFLSLFFSPLLASIPPYATGPVLVLIGAMLISDVLGIHWRTVQEGVPAFLTIALMPLTYSIAYGMIGGIISYMIINGSLFLTHLVQARFFRGSISPAKLPGKDMGEMTPFQIAYHRTFPHADEEEEEENFGVKLEERPEAGRLPADQLGNLYAYVDEQEDPSSKMSPKDVSTDGPTPGGVSALELVSKPGDGATNV